MTTIPHTRTTLVALHGVDKRYGAGATRVDALSGVDLEIARGELVVLLGRAAPARRPC